MGFNYDLSGVRFVYLEEEIPHHVRGTPAEPRVQAWLETSDRLAEDIAKLGGVIIRASSPLPLTDEPTYRLKSPPYEATYDILERGLRKLDIIPAPRFSDLNEQDIIRLHEELEAGASFVLAYTRFERGHGKYLLERSQQLEKVQSVVGKFATQGIGSHLELRRFIPTPSDHYTSYRAVASATGTLLAAGLTYSGHTKYEDKVIENDRFYDVSIKGVRLFKECWESPESPYFLASRDIRSNISSGGGSIPLMGPGLSSISPTEEGILKAHISGDDSKMPPKILETAPLIGKACGPQTSLCVGVDYIKNALTGEVEILEVSIGPGAMTFNKCWLGGKATASEAMYRQYRQAVESIALYGAAA